MQVLWQGTRWNYFVLSNFMPEMLPSDLHLHQEYFFNSKKNLKHAEFLLPSKEGVSEKWKTWRESGGFQQRGKTDIAALH